jgi:hypothetical protein
MNITVTMQILIIVGYEVDNNNDEDVNTGNDDE